MSMVKRGTPRHADRSENNHDKTASWPWLRVRLGSTEPSVEGVTNAPLSPHVLNLRPELVPKTKIINEVEKPLRVACSPKIDFLTLVRPTYRWPDRPISSTRKYLRAVQELSLFLPVEILWWVCGLVWDTTVYAYFKLSVELHAVLHEVWGDVRTYARVVGTVCQAPTRLVHRSGSSRIRLPRDTAVVSSMRRIAFAPQLGFFVLLAFILVLPLKGFATWQSVRAEETKAQWLVNQGLSEFKTASAQLSNGNPALARLDFNQASGNFNQALASLNGLSQHLLGILAHMPGDPQKLVAAQHLVSASDEVSQAAALAASVWQQVVEGSPEQTPQDVGAQVTMLQNALVSIKPHLDEAMNQLRSVPDGGWPTDFGPNVAALLGEVDRLESLVQGAVTLPNFLQQAVISSTPKRYVVMFQNSSELRPTGGFMGSLAFIEMKQGKVTLVQIPGGGPYDFQGSLKTVVAPPQPLTLVRGTWQLQDANWFFDFPTSAKKVLWFLNESGGPAADGVIALTPDVVMNLLKLTGPISMPQYGKTITADNFMREAQLAVEVEYSRALNRPKQFIADLAQVLFQRTLDLLPDQKFELVSVLQQALSQRSIQMYFSEPELESNVQNYGWGGEVRTVPMDYLAVVRTNIGGGKTDAVTDDVVRHQVEVQPDGGLITHLTLTRTHTGSEADIFEQRANIDYLRFYVPQGSVLIQADGFAAPPATDFKPVPTEASLDQDVLAVEQPAPVSQMQGLNITQEFGKTVFAGWLRVDPKDTRTVTLTYRLPFTLTSESQIQDLRRYTVYFQRQAGVKPVDFTSSVTLPEDWRIRYQDGSAPLVINTNTVSFASDWSRDEYYGLLLERLGS